MAAAAGAAIDAMNNGAVPMDEAEPMRGRRGRGSRPSLWSCTRDLKESAIQALKS